MEEDFDYATLIKASLTGAVGCLLLIGVAVGFTIGVIIHV